MCLTKHTGVRLMGLKNMEGILLLGHGSKLPHNSEVIKELSNLIEKKHGVKVAYAFMIINKPSFEEALRELVNKGARRIAVVPVFLAHGVHTVSDIPSLLRLGEGEKKCVYECDGKSVEIFYAEPIGASQELADILYKLSLIHI